MKETKDERFRRVAEARVSKAIKMLRLLGNCSGINTYAYSDDQVEQIFTALQIELDKARQRYLDTQKRRGRFSLSGNPASVPYSISHPHIMLPLPDGTSLRAVSCAGDDYPSINLYLLKADESEELICFAEYNPERSPCHEVCIGVYQSDEDDTKYYAPYWAERNQDE